MKNHKLKFYYAVPSGVKPNATQARHFIHSQESQGLWAEMRDLSQAEITANDAVGRAVSVYAFIGYNPIVLEKYTELRVIDEQGHVYRIKEKPDEFNYAKGDMRVTLYRFEDNDVYTGDEYD